MSVIPSSFRTVPAAVTVISGWRAGPEVLDALRSMFTYGAPPYGNGMEADRASGWLCLDAQDVRWSGPFAQLGPELLANLEKDTGITFTVACFQAYRNGSSCGWHNDPEWDGQAILSLGATRTFGLRRDGEEYQFPMHHGDLLVMPSGFQGDWEHNVMPEEVPGERCSLVFRSPKK